MKRTILTRASLDFASISLTPTTGTLLLRGIFSNPDGKILPGLYARVRVPVKERVAFLVPQEAVGYDQAGSYVLVVNQENVVERIGVRTGTLVDQSAGHRRRPDGKGMGRCKRRSEGHSRTEGDPGKTGFAGIEPGLPPSPSQKKAGP